MLEYSNYFKNKTSIYMGRQKRTYEGHRVVLNVGTVFVFILLWI